MKALITGSSRGIGRAIATELAIAGHEVFLTSRDSSNLEAAANSVSTKGSVVGRMSCDVADEQQVKSLRDYCTQIGFIPDVLVLNAGIFIEGSLTDSSSENFYETMRVDLYHIYHCVKHFVDALRSHHRANVIIIGSTAGLEPYPLGPLYGVAKWGLKGYAINLRKELMRDNIAVTLINPGGTLTDLWEGEELPPNRLLEPRDIGKLVTAILTLSPQAVVEELIVRPMFGDIHE